MELVNFLATFASNQLARSWMFFVAIAYLVSTQIDSELLRVIAWLVLAVCVLIRACVEDKKQVKTPQANGNAE